MTKDLLYGKTALVTGAAKRIGREIARALADAGANVVIHYRESVKEAEKLCRDLACRGVKSWFFEADFEKADAPGRLVREAVAAAGSLDILVNNASIFLPDTVREMDFAGMMRHLQVNAWAPLSLGREFARLVGAGKIVNMLDSRIVGNDRNHVSYTLSKQTLSVLTELMAVEFAPAITVNAVALGLILPPHGKGNGYLDGLAKGIPLKKHGDPRDVVNAVLYLLNSDFVTGQVLFVDGGEHLREGHGPDHHN
jgi:NAD(P)-dependent dehydrogenase (short-subunit alcohol dehydrogenase family)